MTHTGKEKVIYLRQWVLEKVAVVTTGGTKYEGQLTNIVFDSSRLMYIMLDDVICINFDHVVEISIDKGKH